MARFTVVYDASILYSSALRNILLYLRQSGIYQARWTERIHEEWMRSLLRNRPDLSRTMLERTRALIDKASPGALVSGYQHLEAALELPDPDDRHVLAAAIVAKADVILTSNLIHFPDVLLSRYKIEAQHPDRFIADRIAVDAAAVQTAAYKHWRSLKKPPFTLSEYLQALERAGLAESAALLQKMLVP